MGLTEDLKSWVEAELDDGGKLDPEEVDWLKDFKASKDGKSFTFKVDLSFTEEFREVKVEVPKSYPKGTYKYTMLNLTKTLTNCNDLDDVIDKLLEVCESKRDIALNNLVTPTPLDPESPWVNSDDVWGEDKDKDSVKEVQKKIAKDIADFRKSNKTEGWHVAAGACGNNQCWIYLYIDPRKRLKISKSVADAWGVDLDKFITVSLTFTNLYTSGNKEPSVSSFQSGTDKKKFDGTELTKKSKYGLYWTVENRLKQDFFQKYWPLSEKYAKVEKKTGKNYLRGLFDLFEDTIVHSCGRCLICFKELQYEGVKPVVCEEKLCQFSHEQFGLGVDIESVVKKNPDLVDLMITMTFAAAASKSNRFNPFNPYPDGLHIKIKDKNGVEKEYDVKRSGKFDNSKVKKIIDLFPSVKKMQAYVEKGELKKEMFKLHPLAYQLLRWIMASNRCHLRRLKDKESIKGMNTKFQYYLVSSPPEKEQRFQVLKKKYGALYAFHGSALCNWHAIMRVGLKNMSGTAGQINGAAYGSGVYLADDASTSFGYIRYQLGWKKSMFGEKNLGVMACCEIAKHPDTRGMPNPYYVIKNDELLQTRYFFVYQNRGSSNIRGKSLKPPPLLE